MAFHRACFVTALAALLGVGCRDSLNCEDKGGIEKNGSCTCGPGTRPDDTAERCIREDGAAPDVSPGRDGSSASEASVASDGSVRSNAPGVTTDLDAGTSYTSSADSGLGAVNQTAPPAPGDGSSASSSDSGTSPTDNCPPGACSPGTCVSSGTAGCGCDAGLFGPDCATEMCNPNLCQHGGVCGAQGASCDCGASGYTGAQCETDIDECATTNLCTSADYPCVQTAPPGYTCQGQFADWPMPDALAGSKMAPSYEDTTSGIVVDNVTGLIWQRNLPATYAGCTGQYTAGQGQVGDACLWSEAKTYCDGLTLAGQSDWRLPTKIELESIIDETTYNPAIDANVFSGAPTGTFWTASPSVDSSNSARYVSFSNGYSGFNFGIADYAYRVRCVLSTSRSGAATPAGRHLVDTNANTVTDTRTGLVWQRLTKTGTFTWDDSKAQCTDGFRLPALKELLTVIDPTRASPSIDPVFRGETESQSTPADRFWTASPWSQSQGAAWFVDFEYGTANGDGTNSGYRVRCVR